MKPTRATVAGIPARTLRFGDFAVHYANVGGKLVVTDLPAGIEGAKGAGSSLSQSDTYRDAVEASGLPDRTQGFVYVNVGGSVGLLQRLSEQSIPGDVVRNLEPLRSAIEYAVSRSHELQITFFLRIK